MKSLGTISLWLAIIGGLNLGLLGFFDYNLIDSVFGSGALTTVIYDIIGLAAIVLIINELSNEKK